MVEGRTEVLSLLSAKAKIDAKMAENYEDDKITTVISTDLSKAFEIIDHPTLIQKMEFYGIKDGEKKFFESFLSERMQFVELNTKRSKMKQMPDCSVIQGSRLSGCLYTVYTNKAPLVKNL